MIEEIVSSSFNCPYHLMGPQLVDWLVYKQLYTQTFEPFRPRHHLPCCSTLRRNRCRCSNAVFLSAPLTQMHWLASRPRHRSEDDIMANDSGAATPLSQSTGETVAVAADAEPPPPPATLSNHRHRRCHSRGGPACRPSELTSHYLAEPEEVRWVVSCGWHGPYRNDWGGVHCHDSELCNVLCSFQSKRDRYTYWLY